MLKILVNRTSFPSNKYFLILLVSRMLNQNTRQKLCLSDLLFSMYVTFILSSIFKERFCFICILQILLQSCFFYVFFVPSSEVLFIIRSLVSFIDLTKIFMLLDVFHFVIIQLWFVRLEFLLIMTERERALFTGCRSR